MSKNKVESTNDKPENGQEALAIGIVRKNTALRSIALVFYNAFQIVQVIIEALIRNIPWQTGGSWIRRSYYHLKFKKLGKGGRIDEGIIFYGAQGIECGANVVFGRNLVVQAAGGLKLGNDILMGPGCYIWTINHDYRVNNIYHERKYIFEPVVVGNNVWIGANVKILPGVRLGSGCVIGMGSVVTKDIPAYHLAAGNPAIVIKKIENELSGYEA